MAKKFKITEFILLTIILLPVLYYAVFYSHNSPESLLIKALKDCGAQFVSGEIYFQGRVDESFNSIEKISVLSHNIARDMNVLKDSRFSSKTIKNNQIHTVEVCGKTKNGIEVNITGSLDAENEHQKYGYINISARQEMPSKEFVSIKESVSAILERKGINPRISTSFTGRFAGKLDIKKSDEICEEILKKVEARKVEGMTDKTMISLSAYSPVMDTSVEVNGRKVNVNVAIRYNSYENNTYIWLATPMIYTEY